MLHDNQSTEKLISEIDGFMDSLASNITEVCSRLTMLKARKYPHPLMLHPVMKHHELITHGKLHAGLVLLIGGNTKLVDLFKEIPLIVQEALAEGREQSIARFDPKKGEIVEARSSLQKMRQDEIRRLFPGGGRVATFTEQSNDLLAKIVAEQDRKSDREAKVASAKNRALIVGKRRITVPELAIALEKIGYHLAIANSNGKDLPDEVKL